MVVESGYGAFSVNSQGISKTVYSGPSGRTSGSCQESRQYDRNDSSNPGYPEEASGVTNLESWIAFVLERRCVS